MKYLTKLSLQYKMIHFALFISAIVLSCLIICQSLNIGTIVDGILLRHDLQSYIFVIVFVILMLRSLLNASLKLLGSSLAAKIKHTLRTQLTTESCSASEAVTLSSEVIEGIDSFYSDYIPTLYRALIVPIAIILFLLVFHYQTALIMLITAPFIPIFYIIIGINTQKKAVEQMTALTQFSNYFLDTILGLTTIKLFGYERQVKEEVQQKSQSFKDKTMNILKTAFLSTLMLEFISMLSIGIIALEIGLGLVVFHSISFYTALVVLMLAPEFYNALKDLGLAFHTGKQATGYVELLAKSKQLFAKRTYEDRDDIQMDTTISFEHLNMDMDALILLEHMVIFGPSGAGKSTFARLITGVQQSEGEIKLPVTLEHNISYLSQEPYVFSGTIRENITMKKDISDEVLINLAGQVGMLEKINQLPKGFDTMIGHGGFQLSGGETHRLMLIRTLLQPKGLIIFDEPTGMLDVDTKEIIDHTINRLKQTAVVWTIAHRRSTIHAAELLMLIEEGKIKKIGAPSNFQTEPFYKAVTS